MSFFSKINFNKNHYLNFLIALFPVSFIAGNMIININMILLIISALLFFKNEPFKIKFFLLDKILLAYFVLILITAVANDFHFYLEKLAWKGYFSTTIKSFLFLRYFLFYLILRFLIEEEIVNLKIFFIISSLAVFFVSFDIFYQYFNGKDIFGFVNSAYDRKLSGPFGDELIAGSYIQRYSLFTFFLIPLFFESFKKFNKYILLFAVTIFLIALIISGNRMPTIMFIFIIFCMLIAQKKTRKLFIPCLVIFVIIFTILVKSNVSIRKNFHNFYGQVSQIVYFVSKKDFFSDKSPQYLKEFATFYDTWLINKYIGGGIKNFRYYCHKRDNINTTQEFVCNMHPHNYYLEILTETGLVGFLTIIIIFTIILYITLAKKYFTKSSLEKNIIMIPFLFLFIAEVFPLKSTGSFFTTGNSTYLFFIIGILVGIVRKENLIENKN